MKFITRKEAMNRKKYVTAPFDETNLSSDWIEDYLPDYGVGVSRKTDMGSTEILTFINGEPWRIFYYRNHISFFPLDIENDMERIKSHVEDLVGETEGLCATWNKCVSHCSFNFYWELDE